MKRFKSIAFSCKSNTLIWLERSLSALEVSTEATVINMISLFKWGWNESGNNWVVLDSAFCFCAAHQTFTMQSMPMMPLQARFFHNGHAFSTFSTEMYLSGITWYKTLEWSAGQLAGVWTEGHPKAFRVLWPQMHAITSALTCDTFWFSIILGATCCFNYRAIGFCGIVSWKRNSSCFGWSKMPPQVGGPQDGCKPGHNGRLWNLFLLWPFWDAWYHGSSQCRERRHQWQTLARWPDT